MSTQHTTIQITTNPEVLESLQLLAENEGKDIQIIIDEAFTEFLMNKQNRKSEIIEAFNKSMAEHDSLYRKLAE